MFRKSQPDSRGRNALISRQTYPTTYPTCRLRERTATPLTGPKDQRTVQNRQPRRGPHIARRGLCQLLAQPASSARDVLLRYAQKPKVRPPLKIGTAGSGGTSPPLARRKGVHRREPSNRPAPAPTSRTFRADARTRHRRTARRSPPDACPDHRRSAERRRNAHLR